MSEIITAEVGGTFTPVPADNHVSRCVGLYVLGQIEGTFEGHPKIDKKIILAFEHMNTNHVFKEGEAPKPFISYKEYTHSLNSRSNLRKHLDNWSGTKLTDEKAAKFNLSDLVDPEGLVTGQKGYPCLVNVVHKTKDKGGISSEVMGISKIPEGTPVPAARTPLIIFNINNFKQEVFDKLPKWIQNKMQKSSIEYKKMFGSGTAATTAKADDDDNPFAKDNIVNADSVKKLF